MNIKILVATHKSYWMPIESVYIPIHVGKEGKEDIGYIGDNTGEHISQKNPNYCELTALYWAWKNLEADYIGLVHYRRHFTHKERWGSENKKKAILTTSQWEDILKDYPIVVADKRKYYIETNREHYYHAHHREGLDATEKIIYRIYPDYIPAFEKVCNRRWAHMFNMFVMRKDYYDAYCQWLFSILCELESEVDISQYDTYEARIYGFVAERLLDVWLEANHLEVHEQNVSFIESQNWLKKGSAFLWRHISNRIKK